MTESASFSNTTSAISTAVGDGVAVDFGEDKSWQDLANCLGVDPDLFFPERGASTREAKEVCRGCVVRDDCLEYALANGEKFGIWGGMSERERRRIRRQRALARAAATSAPVRTTATA
jgi:WhiB family redox-sensing transcriptional regulator